jgi:hypothetical protein
MRVYSARDYLAAFEPWLLEDLSALAGIIGGDTYRAHEVAHKLLIPNNIDGRYPVEVWLGVHPLYSKKSVTPVQCRRVRSSVTRSKHVNDECPVAK